MMVLSFIRMTALVVLWLMFSDGAVSCPTSEKAPKSMLLLLEKDNDQTVDIALGEAARIRLPENATTGYRWSIEHYDDEFIEALTIEPRYLEKAAGSGGEVAFIFQPKKMGLGEIVLKHWRPWEGESSVIARYRVRLNVKQ